MQDLREKLKIIFEDSSFQALYGCALGVCIEEDTYFFSSGLASLNPKVDIVPDTKFHIASLTKRFTALLCNIAEEQKLLNKSDLLTKYFPDIILKHEGITIQHLLEHRSGIRDQWELAGFSGVASGELITNELILTQFSKQEKLNFPCGKYYLYCNTGYTLIALILEKVTGHTVQKLTQMYFSDKYQLASTGYYFYNDQVAKSLATPYSKNKSGALEISKPSFQVTGSTSMYSSAVDLIKLERYFYQKNDIKLHREEENRASSFYKDGMINIVWSGERIQLHSGWDYGYSSFLFRIPNRKLSIVLLCNYGVPNLLKYVLKIAVEIDTRIRNVDQVNLNAKSLEESNTNKLKPGFYLNSEANLINIITIDNDLIFYEQDELLLLSTDRYQLKNSINHLSLISNEEFYLEILDTKLHFQYLANEFNNMDLDLYVGSFYSAELEITYLIKRVEGQLHLHIGEVIHKLKIIDNIYFKNDHFTVKFIFKEGRVNSLSISNLRAWNIEFVKNLVHKI